MPAFDPTDTVRECVSCRRCYPSNEQFCRDCMVELIGIETIPYVIDSRYRLEKVISHGSIGVAFIATDDGGPQVVVKIVRASTIANPRAQDRFRREATIAKGFHHPNIATVIDFGLLKDASGYVVSEYVKGQTLRKEIKRRGKFPVKDAIQIVAAVCDMLDAAHRAGLVHRALKPESIILVESPDSPIPTVKLVGFNFTKIAFGRLYSPGMTVKLQGQGHLPRRPTYVSPEQFKGDEADLRSDIFSLGVIAYEMLAGAPPLSARKMDEFGAKLLNERPAPLRSLNPSVNPMIEAEILRAMEKDPVKRHQRANEFKLGLINGSHLS